jgi:hypothetical protein
MIMSKEMAIEKLRLLLDRGDLCPKCNIRKSIIEEAIRELEQPEDNDKHLNQIHDCNPAI